MSPNAPHHAAASAYCAAAPARSPSASASWGRAAHSVVTDRHAHLDTVDEPSREGRAPRASPQRTSRDRAPAVVAVAAHARCLLELGEDRAGILAAPRTVDVERFGTQRSPPTGINGELVVAKAALNATNEDQRALTREPRRSTVTPEVAGSSPVAPVS